MRVLHLIKALGRGGAEVLLAEGLAVADRRRFDFAYGYLQARPDDVAADLRRQGAPVHCFRLQSNRRILLGARRLVLYLRDNEIDLIHAHLPMAGVLARIAGSDLPPKPDPVVIWDSFEMGGIMRKSRFTEE